MDHRFFLTAATLALVAGCGQDAACPFSGCGPSGPQGGTGGSGLITLDEDNFLPAVREAWFAATTTAGLPFFVVATGVGETTSGTVVVDPAGPTAYDCPVSGTFTVTGDVADPDTVTAGDFVTYESSACDSGTGYTVDGVHSLDIASIVGDVASGQFEQAQNLAFTDFRAASPTLVTTLNGDHTAVIDTQAANTVTTAFSGNSLAVNEEQITVSIRNYSGSASLQTISPFGYTLDTAGNANSSIVVGSFDYSTDEPIQQQIGEHPFDGILDIFGAGVGTARILIEDSTTVHVQLDANGSTNYEVSTPMTWDDFLGGTAGP
jgi:hypothetical protein